MLRLLGILVVALCAITSAVLTFPGFFRVERIYPIAQIVSFRGILALAFAAAALLALLFAIARPLRAFALSLALVAGIATALGTVEVLLLPSSEDSITA